MVAKVLYHGFPPKICCVDMPDNDESPLEYDRFEEDWNDDEHREVSRPYSEGVLRFILRISHYKCHLCGHKHVIGGYEFGYWNVEHVHPEKTEDGVLEGATCTWNLLVACGRCNEMKGRHLMDELPEDPLPYDPQGEYPFACIDGSNCEYHD